MNEMEELIKQLRDIKERFIFQGGSGFAQAIADALEAQQARIAELQEALEWAEAEIGWRFEDVLGWPDDTSVRSAHDAAIRKAALLETQQAEISSFCMNYRMKCDEETKSLHIQIEAQQARIAELENALRKYARDFVLVSGGDALATHDAAVRKAALQEAIKVVETYRVSVGNSASGEIAAEWTMENLREIRDELYRMMEV